MNDGGRQSPTNRPDEAAQRLLHRIVSLENLRFAWNRVEDNNGRPGSDGVSVRRFERLLDANLIALADEVLHGGYRPEPLRRFTIQMGRKRRVLQILSVRDRVLQRAALDILSPLWEPRFLPTSFGYRPGRSLHDAVVRIVRLRDAGNIWVVDADIRDCFNRLDHAQLRQLLARRIFEPDLLRLLTSWFSPAPATCGVPQGAVISPLFCNIYLHELDASLKRRRLHGVRYADDFVILCRSEAHAEHALRATEKILAGLKLELNQKKTRVVSFDEGFDFLGVHFEGTDYSYTWEGKRITIDELSPDFFYYHTDGYE